MNTTKWRELIGAISYIKALPIKYKNIFENDCPQDFWTLDGDEYLLSMDKSTIECLRISCTIEKQEYLGQLLKPKMNVVSVRDEVESILKRYSINYEYDEKDNSLVIYCYR